MEVPAEPEVQTESPIQEQWSPIQVLIPFQEGTSRQCGNVEIEYEQVGPQRSAGNRQAHMGPNPLKSC